MIYIRTCAYNAEATIERAIDSVLNQTYQDFIYYILDNGATDRTGEIIRAYAARDSRIVPFYNRVNRNFAENPDFWNLSRKIPAGDYFCILDADDAYDPAFFEEMLQFVQKHSLDVAACGSLLEDRDTGAIVSKRVLEQDLVLKTPREFDALFPAVYWNLRQVWGKLYSARAAAARYESDMPEWFPKAYGGDTINVLEPVNAVGNFGVLAKALHTYSISQKSVSYRWIPGRTESDVILYEKGMEFLERNCGRVSDANRQLLINVYANALSDTVHVIHNAAMDPAEKLAELRHIAEHPITQGAFRWPVADAEKAKENLLVTALNAGCRVKEQSADLEAILKQLPAVKPLLNEVTETVFPQVCPDLYLAVWKGQYGEALDKMTGLLLDGLEPDPPFLRLYVSLSALTGEEAAFLFGKVRLAQALLRQGDRAGCRALLEELAEMGVQENEEIRALREALDR